MNRIRLLLADDHMLFAEGLQSLLRDEFELLGTVANGKELVEATHRLNPEVILVDISMPVLNGFDAVRRIRKDGNSAKVIFLTMHDDETLVAEAFRCGGSGYVLKQAAGEELVTAIREVAQGNNYLTPLVTSKPVEPLASGTSRLTLTPRQREVLKLISEGMTMKEIAVELNISTRTAESHKYEMMQALGVETTAELIRYALRIGLIS
ncbi:MAG TPA: response regulator transcription factor [Pyrinomonadaceae bacterium]|nr:response regulator transcription factor [Pyrinomonadaceae bacterium]